MIRFCFGLELTTNQAIETFASEMKQKPMTAVAEQTKVALDIQGSTTASEKERGALAAELKQREARITELEGKIAASKNRAKPQKKPAVKT